MRPSCCRGDGNLEEMAAELESRGAFRVLRRLSIEGGATGEGREEGSATGIVLDVETTGLDPQKHKVIELAMRRFRFDGDGVITGIDCAVSWLEDPGTPLEADIARLTGLRDFDLSGQRIDDAAATSLMLSADVVIAHNAAFDRKFVERRLPGAAGLAWACSCKEVDWAGRGLDGRGLGWLLSQCGYFHGAHRAGSDVDAVLAVLGHRTILGTTALSELLERAATPGWIVTALGAHFDVKDSLKARGYRWDGTSSVWRREVAEPGRAAELAWLYEHVYADHHRPRADGPVIDEVTWLTRHA